MSEAWEGTAETADSPQGPPDGGSIHGRRHVRHVREDNTSTSDEPGMSDCGSAEPAVDPTAVTDGDRSGGIVGRIVRRFHPPDIAGDRPGLAKLRAYAYYGAGAPADGPLRTVQIWWYRLVARPNTAWAYQKAWMLERPFRGTPVLIVQIAWWVLNIVTLARLL